MSTPKILQAPKNCDNCSSKNIQLTTHFELYGKTCAHWPHIYHCKDCDATVGCHAHTMIPLGRMADRATRTLRKLLHDRFDLIWKSGLLTRDGAYGWLARQLNVNRNDCHIAWFSKNELNLAITISTEYYNEYQHIAERRKEKRNVKVERRAQIEKSKIIRRKLNR